MKMALVHYILEILTSNFSKHFHSFRDGICYRNVELQQIFKNCIGYIEVTKFLLAPPVLWQE